MLAAANDALEVVPNVAGCKICVIAPLADHDEICVALVVVDRVTETAVLLIGFDLLHTCCV